MFTGLGRRKTFWGTDLRLGEGILDTEGSRKGVILINWALDLSKEA